VASGSKSSTSTSSSQATNVSELNLQDTGGITVADNAGPTNVAYTSVTTDQGAVQASFDAITAAVKAAFGGNTNVTNSAINLAQDASHDATSAAITLGSNAIDSGVQVANHGLDNAAAAYQSGLTFGTSALNTVANLIQDSATREANLTSTALSGYQSIAQQNSASNATQIQQVALYVIVAAVAIVVLPKLFKS
jgi:hypothetical protein